MQHRSWGVGFQRFDPPCLILGYLKKGQFIGCICIAATPVHGLTLWRSDPPLPPLPPLRPATLAGWIIHLPMP